MSDPKPTDPLVEKLEDIRATVRKMPSWDHVVGMILIILIVVLAMIGLAQVVWEVEQHGK